MPGCLLNGHRIISRLYIIHWRRRVSYSVITCTNEQCKEFQHFNAYHYNTLSADTYIDFLILCINTWLRHLKTMPAQILSFSLAVLQQLHEEPFLR